jgi:cobalt-zinc-cadmium efflux system protein
MGDDHSHTHGTGNLSERRLFWAGLLTAGTMLAEAIGGIYAGSLALLADAGHMLTDSAALALAWLAVRMAARPADWKRTYGFQRFEVLAAFANGLALFFISAVIAWEAVSRIFMPVEVLGGTMLVIATLGLLVNLGTLLILRTGGGANLNVRAALLHVMSDLLGSVAAILAALVILWAGWTAIDPLLSILITVLILRSAWLITKDAGHILLEGAPSGLDVREVQKDLEASRPVDPRHSRLVPQRGAPADDAARAHLAGLPA